MPPPSPSPSLLNWLLRVKKKKKKECFERRGTGVDRHPAALAITKSLSKWAGDQQHPMKPRSRCGHGTELLGLCIVTRAVREVRPPGGSYYPSPELGLPCGRHQ